jgi:hypothetical protein
MNISDLKQLPYDIEIFINKYIHELKMIEIKKEIKKNFKNSFIYILTWKGYFDFFKAFQKLENDDKLSLFFKNKLKYELSNIVYNDIVYNDMNDTNNFPDI